LLHQIMKRMLIKIPLVIKLGELGGGGSENAMA